MKYKLDLDDESPFEDWSFLLFHTTMPSYALADSLNRLYDYRLARIDNLQTTTAAWPLFTFEDTVSHLKYFLLERPAAATAWERGDMLLVVGGENASAETDAIYEDFTEPAEPDPTDLLATEHAALLGELLAGFTMVSPIDFTQSTSGKRRSATEQCCHEIVEGIEKRHLDMSADERRRLEENIFLQN